MRVYFSDFPRYFSCQDYKRATDRMVQRLSGQKGVLSIFQVGSVSNPGISDIDLVVVFNDGKECRLNPLRDLSNSERYLFPHSLYGLSESHFREARCSTFFHNYHLLWGEKLPIRNNGLSEEEIQALKTQTALEYLIKMFITRSVELTYGIVRVRELMLQTKALRYDLEFLNVNSGSLSELIDTLVGWRNNWFKTAPLTQKLKRWVYAFHRELGEFIEKILARHAFYVPEQESLKAARNMALVPSSHFGYAHKGLVLPPWFRWLGRKYFKLQHRLNNFYFLLPINSSKTGHVVEKQYAFLKDMRAYNRIMLPHFLPLNSSLNILG